MWWEWGLHCWFRIVLVGRMQDARAQAVAYWAWRGYVQAETALTAVGHQKVVDVTAILLRMRLLNSLNS